MAQVLINGSHGTLVVDAETGAVMEYQISCDDKQQCRYNSIKAIDFGQLPRDKDYDILDVGFWYELDGKRLYEPPVDRRE